MSSSNDKPDAKYQDVVGNGQSSDPGEKPTEPPSYNDVAKADVLQGRHLPEDLAKQLLGPNDEEMVHINEKAAKNAEVKVREVEEIADYEDDVEIEEVEDIHDESEAAEQSSRKESQVGTVSLIEPAPMPIASGSLATAATEKIFTYPGLKACRRVLSETASACPNEDCKNIPQVIQQAMPAEDERCGQEMVVFRQEHKKGVWVDVAIDITPKLEQFRKRGYKRFRRDRATLADFEKIHTTQLASFDCANCGRFKFRYQMVVFQEKREGLKNIGRKGRLLFTLHKRDCIQN